MQRDRPAVPVRGARPGAGPSPSGDKNHCHLSLFACDPHSLFVWWNLPEPVLRFAAAGQPAREPLRLALKIYEIHPGAPLAKPLFTGTPERGGGPYAPADPGQRASEESQHYQVWLDIEVSAQNAMYVNVPGNGRTYVAELGVYQNGAYRPLLRSLPHATPWGEPSETIDPAWPPLEMLYRTIRPLSFPSSPQSPHAGL